MVHQALTYPLDLNKIKYLILNFENVSKRLSLQLTSSSPKGLDLCPVLLRSHVGYKSFWRDCETIPEALSKDI